MMRIPRTRTKWLAAAVVAGALSVGSPAAAQTRDQQSSGQLDENSRRDGRPYEVRQMTLEAGKRYAFSAESKEFDPALRLSFANAEDEEIATDDDGGEGRNAYLEFTPERSGQYRLRVLAVDDSMGAYALHVRELAPLPAPQRPAPASSSQITFKNYVGALTRTDGEVRGRRVDDYLFRFEGGKQVMIFMDRETDSLDPMIEVRAGTDRYSDAPIARDDDGGDGTNALLIFTPDESGEYLVRATSSGEDNGFGGYSLRVGQQP